MCSVFLRCVSAHVEANGLKQQTKTKQDNNKKFLPETESEYLEGETDKVVVTSN